jgi:hypothetical protein
MSIQDESLVGCCEMFCGNCIARAGNIAETTNNLLKKGVDGCWICGEFKDCDSSAWLSDSGRNHPVCAGS